MRAYAQALEGAARSGTRDERAGIAAQLAHHWLLAHDLERALPATLGAARAARRSVRLSGGPGVPRAQPGALGQGGPEIRYRPASIAPCILEEAAEAAAQAGDPRRSIDLVRSALAETDPNREPMRVGVLYHRLAWYLNESGDWQAGVAAMERAAALDPDRSADAMSARRSLPTWPTR